MKNKSTLVSVITATILVLLAVVYAIFAGTVKPGKSNVVFFGDSIVGNDRTEGSVTAQLSKKTGLTVYNAGIGGTKLTKGRPDYNILDRYNMLNFARVVENGDFTVYLTDNLSSYFELNDVIDYAGETIKNLAYEDLDYADVFIVEQGVNDFLDRVAAFNPDDPYDEMTIEGSLREIIRIFKTKYPDKQLIVVSPGYFDIEAGNSDELDMGYGTIEEFVRVEKEICEENGIIFIDFYHDSGIDETNYKEYLIDGLHTNAKGNERLASLIAEVLQ